MIGKYFVLFITIGTAAAIQKIPVSIYYETLCQDSMNFFTKQFTPTWRDLKEYINLELVPFGKTTSSFPSNGANPKFECHHGPAECIGNKFQSCLMAPVYHYSQDDQVPFIDCLMTYATKEKLYNETAAECKGKIARNLVDVSLLSYCSTGQDGDKLLLENQKRTERIQNPLKYVPTIVFNGQFNDAESKEAEKSFRSVLCKHITDSPKPKACEISGAPITTVGLLTLFATGLIVRFL